MIELNQDSVRYRSWHENILVLNKHWRHWGNCRKAAMDNLWNKSLKCARHLKIFFLDFSYLRRHAGTFELLCSHDAEKMVRPTRKVFPWSKKTKWDGVSLNAGEEIKRGDYAERKWVRSRGSSVRPGGSVWESCVSDERKQFLDFSLNI